jgi:methionyl-tRNA formyltransferase
MSATVVFAYHNVGCRCLAVLLAHGVDVRLVVTHRDNPLELIWFDSVAALAGRYAIPVITPDDPNAAEVVARVRGAAPQWLFSFYYRHMLGSELLATAGRGAFNMHGSLLPKYRGRVPVNWAVIRGEHETGASLHHMAIKPDAGDLVDQMAVPILPDDTAREVFDKVTVAAEIVLDRQLEAIVAGTAPRTPLDLAAGCYFGGRRPEDGAIDWTRPAAEVHNLVRGVAPPYPGAFTRIGGEPARLLRTSYRSIPTAEAPGTLFVSGDRIFAACGDGHALPVFELEVAGARLDARTFSQRHGARLRAAA